MDREKKLVKNTIILFIGSFFTKIVKYFLLPIYTGYLTTTEYGTVELYNTIINLFVPIIGLQIEHGIFRFLVSNRNNETEKSKFISSVIVFTVVSTIVSFIIFCIFSSFIKIGYRWLLIANLILCNGSSLVLQISRGLGENKEYSITSFLVALTTIVFNMLFLMGINMKIDGVLYGSVIGYAVGIIYLFMRLKLYKYISVKDVDKLYLKKMLKYSMPMIPNTLSWWVFSSSDRIIISIFCGLSATGILSVAYKFSNIGIMIYTIFNLSITESIVLHINDDDISEYYNKIYNIIGGLFVLMTAVLLSTMPIMYNLLVNKSFNSAYGLIPIAVIATLFQVFATMLGTVYIAKNNTKSVAITSIWSAVINIVSDLIMVYFVGIYAAIISTLLSYVLLFVYRLIDVNKKYFRVKIKKELIINTIFIVVIIAPLYYIEDLYVKILNFVISIAISLLINKKGLCMIKLLFKKRFKRI